MNPKRFYSIVSISHQMGNTEDSYLNTLSVIKFQAEDWSPVNSNDVFQDALNRKAQYGQYQTFRHNLTGVMMDKYDLVFPTQEQMDFYMESFLWRLQEENLVTATFFEKKPNELCTFQRKASVFLPRISLRLDDITDIPYPYELTLLTKVFNGFQKLFEHVGYFKVRQGQICLDVNGDVRVWINSDLSKNYAENGQFIHVEGMLSESEMVKQILQLVFENTDQESEPEPLEGFILQRLSQSAKNLSSKHSFSKKISFEEVRGILQEYIAKNNTEIPPSFAPILEIMQEGNYEHSNQEESVSQQDSKIVGSEFFHNLKGRKSSLKERKSNAQSDSNSFVRLTPISGSEHDQTPIISMLAFKTTRLSDLEEMNNQTSEEDTKVPSVEHLNFEIRSNQVQELEIVSRRRSGASGQSNASGLAMPFQSRLYEAPPPLQLSFRSSQDRSQRDYALHSVPEPQLTSNRKRNSSDNSYHSPATDRPALVPLPIQQDPFRSFRRSSGNSTLHEERYQSTHQPSVKQGVLANSNLPAFDVINRSPMADGIPSTIRFFLQSKPSSVHTKRLRDARVCRPKQFVQNALQLTQFSTLNPIIPPRITEHSVSKEESKASDLKSEVEEVPHQFSVFSQSKAIQLRTILDKNIQGDSDGMSDCPTLNGNSHAESQRNEDGQFIDRKGRRNTLLSNLEGSEEDPINESMFQPTMNQKVGYSWILEEEIRKDAQDFIGKIHQNASKIGKESGHLDWSNSEWQIGKSTTPTTTLEHKLHLQPLRCSETLTDRYSLGETLKSLVHTNRRKNSVSMFLDPDIMQDLMALQTMEEL